MIDFGIAKELYLPSGRHIRYRDNVKLNGTWRYMSVDVQRGVEPSRKDDMESIGYCLEEWLRGSLPWQWHQMEAQVEIKKYFKGLQSLNFIFDIVGLYILRRNRTTTF